jgi:hypothetical protein
VFNIRIDFHDGFTACSKSKGANYSKIYAFELCYRQIIAASQIKSSLNKQDSSKS